ncbi:MAG: DUF5691 domain-containing protein [Aggregatilineales bacterium]
MALPNDLIQRVVAGTMHRTSLINATQTGLDILLVQKHAHEEHQILLMSGGLDFRQQAGFVPSQLTDWEHMPGCRPEKRPSCSRRTLRYLYAMLDDYLLAVMPEFLQNLQMRRERLPDEVLPGILTLGEKRILWQGYIRPVLGRRGRWLAETSQKPEWQWVWHTPTHLNTPEKPKYSEETLIQQLRKSGRVLHPHHRAIESLRDYKMPWSVKLTDEFFDVLRRQIRSKEFDARAYFTMALAEFALYIPVNRKAEMLQILNVRTKATYYQKFRISWHDAASEVQKVFEFREGMLNTIYKRRYRR